LPWRRDAGDRRLASISNVGLSTGQYSNFAYTTRPENVITAIEETSDSSVAYPSPLAQTANYNNLNQLTNLSGQTLTYDADGNLVSDGQRSYTWDAENRLIGISFPGQAGKATIFTYDGLGRRTTMSNTPGGGGSPVVISYIWCGMRICQALNANNSPTREYFAEGEFEPGATAQSYYYGFDQVGSVRRVFSSIANAPAYGYDPYGNALQGAAAVTDFGYAGMFYTADSGLNVTLYRPYDPIAGRWLSRDPVEGMGNQTGSPSSVSPWDEFSRIAPTESSGNLQVSRVPAFGFVESGGRTNGDNSPGLLDAQKVAAQISLYEYANSNPISYVDPRGDQWTDVAGAVAGFIGGFGGDLLGQGIGGALNGSPCPVNLKQALWAGLAGGVGGAINPVAGFSSFIATVEGGIYAGAVVGVGSSF
jgi:RHS repeat-associated protein